MSRIDFLDNGNPFDNGDMQIGQQWGGTNATGIVGTHYVADRWFTTRDGAFQWRAEQRGAGRPLVGEAGGLAFPINNYIQIQPEIVVNPVGSQVFYIAHNFEAYKIPWMVYKRMKVGFLVNSNQTGTYTCQFLGANSNVKYVTSYTIDQANTWERKVFEIDFAPMHNFLTFPFDFGRGLTMVLPLSTGPDVTGVEPENQWVSTAPIVNNIRGVAGQANLAANTSNVFNVTGFRAMALDYPGQEVDLWRMKPPNIDEALRDCMRYYETSYLGTGNRVGAASPGAEVLTSANGNVGGTLKYISFKVPKNLAPVGTVYDNTTNDNPGFIRNNSASGTAAAEMTGETTRGMLMRNTAAAVTSNVYSFHWVADSRLT
jgi:hypothetical protein